MPDQPVNNKRSPDTTLRLFKEYFTAALAMLFVFGVFAMTILSFQFIATSTTDPFARIKDLLLIYTPFLGVILGYYFNKITSDARAETAENAAQAAAANAQQASEVRNEAVARAQEAQTSADQMRSSLQEVTKLAKDMVNQTTSLPTPETGTLSANPSFEIPGAGVVIPETMIRTRLELQNALERAQNVLENNRL
jgi:hypothetical protein